MQAQGLLFSEPSISDTGVWCQLPPEIDPAKWARVYQGSWAVTARAIRNRLSSCYLQSRTKHPKSVSDRLKSLFSAKTSSNTRIPLVSVGPGEIGVNTS